jgi:aromatic ring-opening dioxygenase LigB subunit
MIIRRRATTARNTPKEATIGAAKMSTIPLLQRMIVLIMMITFDTLKRTYRRIPLTYWKMIKMIKMIRWNMIMIILVTATAMLSRSVRAIIIGHPLMKRRGSNVSSGRA